MSFLDLLHDAGDKVNLSEMALVKSKLPARIMKPIPACMYTDDSRYDYEVVILLAWVIARRENKDIMEQEVGDLIGLKEEGHLEQIEKEILYFYSRQTMKEINDQFEKIHEAKLKVLDETEKAENQLEVEKSVDPPEEPTE